MRFEVPQFIEIEDKVIGPLTWKQFVYLAGGGGLAVTLFLNAPTMIFVLVGLPGVALAAALAFHRVNNRPFSVFLEACFAYISRTKLYLWRKDQTQSAPPVTGERDTETVQNPLTFVQKKNLSALARSLDNVTPE